MILSQAEFGYTPPDLVGPPVRHQFKRIEQYPSAKEQAEMDLAEKFAETLKKGGNTSTVEKEIDDVLIKYGLDPDKAMTGWTINSVRDGRLPDYITNLYQIQLLEKERPGIVGSLFKEFGILNFLRYEPWVLLDQYDKRQDDQLPYGIVIMPYSDHNGIFAHRPKTREVFEDVVTQLYGKYRLRFFEAKTKKDVVQHLKHNATRYPNHKISFLFLAAHGNPDTIDLGGYTSDGKIKIGDVDKIEPERLKKFFVEEPPIVLISCSVGIDQGIAQSLSKIGGEITAPDSNTQGINSAFAHIEGDHINFDVTFEGSNHSKFKHGVKMEVDQQ